MKWFAFRATAVLLPFLAAEAIVQTTCDVGRDRLTLGLRVVARNLYLEELATGRRYRPAGPDEPFPEAVVLGGSTSTGYPRVHGEGWPELLGVRVQNLAICAHSSMEQLHCYAAGGKPARWVIIYHGINDAGAGLYGRVSPDYSHVGLRAPALDPPEWVLSTGIGVEFVRGLTRPRNPAHLFDSQILDYFLRNMDLTLGLARARGASVVIGTQPLPAATREKELGRGTILANEASRQWARSRSVRVVDLENRPDMEGHFVDAIHLSAEGNQIVAKAFREAIR